MVCAARLSQRVCGFSIADAARQEQLLTVLGLPTQLPKLDRSAILSAMTRDKKVEHGLLRFVLADRIGAVAAWSRESIRRMCKRR